MVYQATPSMTEPPQLSPNPVKWRWAILVYVVLAVIFGLGAVFGLFVMMALAVPLTLGAIPYTLIATFFILRGRRAARKALDAMQYVEVDVNVGRFGGWWQRLSLLNGLVLGALGVALLISLLNFVPPLSEISMGILALIAMFSAVEIIVNAGWIYPKRTVLAEEFALKTRTHSWKLILANRWLGWVIWWTGAVLAGYLVVSQFVVTSTLENYMVR